MKFLRANMDMHQGKTRPVLINLNIASFASFGTATKVILPDEIFVIVESFNEVQNTIGLSASNKPILDIPEKLNDF